MAWPVEHDDGDLRDGLALGDGDRLEVVFEWSFDVDRIGGICANGDLLHVHRRARVEHRARLCEGDHAERVGLPLGGQRRALERVDGHIDNRWLSRADLLATVEHRCFVLLPLADDDRAVHLDGREHVAHRIDRRLVCGDLVTTADHACR